MANQNQMSAVNGNNTTLSLAQSDPSILRQQMDLQYQRMMEDRRLSDRERREQKMQRRREEAYRTQLCKNFMRGDCPHGDACHYAHGQSELRQRQHGPNYKTKLCRNYSNGRFCAYGSKCDFIHKTPVLPNATNGQHHFVFPSVTNGQQQQQLLILPPLSSPQYVLPPELSLFNFNTLTLGSYNMPQGPPFTLSLPSRPEQLMHLAVNMNSAVGYQQHHQGNSDLEMMVNMNSLMMMQNNGN